MARATAVGGALAWSNVYDGFQNHLAGTPSTNLEPGWCDLQPSQGGLGWGFGGAPSGFTVDPNDSNRALLTNSAVVHLTENGGGGGPTNVVKSDWKQRYSELASGALRNPAATWRTVGVDVTTTWHYYVHPTTAGLHFLASTDIGLARSADYGDSWASANLDSTGIRWGNCYELAFNSAGTKIWAAVSVQHDIPHETQIGAAAANLGMVLVNPSGDGLIWDPYPIPGLPNPLPPVVSIIYDEPNDDLYISIWRAGVYRSHAGAAWSVVGTGFPSGAGNVNNHRLRLHQGTLYCLVAADRRGGTFKRGQLLEAQLPAGAWTDMLGASVIGSPSDFEFRSPASNDVYVTTESVQGAGAGSGVFKGTLAAGNWTWSAQRLPIPFDQAKFGYVGAFGVSWFGDHLFVGSTSEGVFVTRDEINWKRFLVPAFDGVQRLEVPNDPASGRSALYITTFGGGAYRVERCYFLSDKSTFSQDEVTLQGAASFDNAFYLVLDGFLAGELGVAAAAPAKADFLAPNVKPTLATNLPGVTLELFDLIAPTSFASDVFQRFVYSGRVTFTNAAAAFNALGTAPSARFDLTAALQSGAFDCRTQIELLKAGNPYMIDGPTSWLSTDVAVFKVSATDTPFGGFAVGTAANAYIKNVLGVMNNQIFDQLAAQQGATVLELSEKVAGVNMFNFAIARVRYRGSAQASQVQAFFRLFNTAATGFDYDPQSAYRRAPYGATGEAISLLGKRSGLNDLITIPCFAEARTPSGMDQQRDPTNEQTLSASTGTAETVAFYGAWLDLNQPSAQRFPLRPATDGPWTAADNPQSIQSLIRGRHQCLVVELWYPPDPNQIGDTPGSSDNLAQRNLAIVESDNPGGPDAHLVTHTLAIRSWQRQPPQGETTIARDHSGGGHRSGPLAPHEYLLFRWGGLPPATKAMLYAPGLPVDRVIALAGPDAGLDRVDSDTLALRVRDLSLVPLPPLVSDVPALLSLQLPDTVRYGQNLSVIVQQLTRERRIAGTVELTIPVSYGEAILPAERRTLAVLKAIVRDLPSGDRWAPVFRRYVDTVATRVRGLGDDPDSIPPSGAGTPDDRDDRDDRGRMRGCCLVAFPLAILLAAVRGLRRH